MSKQIKGLLYFYGSDQRYSLIIFWTILTAILLVSLAITYFLASLDNEDTLFTFSLTGPMYVYCAIWGFMTVKESVPFLIKMSATRKNIFVGTGIFFLALSFGMALAATILQELIMALMNATGIDLFVFLHPAYFLDDNTWYTRILIDTSIMFFFMAVLFIIGLLFYKYGLAGGGSFLGVVLLIILLGIAQGWIIDFFVDVFTGIDLVFFYQLLGIGVVIYGISFLFLRRITTVKVK